MKKYVTILLILLLFINSGGFIIVFYGIRTSVRKDIFTAIQHGNFNPSEVVLFTIDKDKLFKDVTDFVWNDENEFEYRGRLFDIIKTVSEGNKVVLYCINDLAEEKIVKSFNGEINNLANGDLKDPKIKTSISNIISQALISCTFNLPFGNTSHRLYSYVDGQTIKPEQHVQTPPPK